MSAQQQPLLMLDVARVSPVNEIYTGTAKNATLVAIFVPVDKAGDVSTVLSEHGFSELSVPKLEGNVDSAIATLEGGIKSLEGEMAPLQKKLADMKKQYEDLMLATDEYLSMQTRKTEAPLRFAETANAFVIDGYVPSDQFSRLKSELESAAEGRLEVQLIADKEAEELVEKGEDIPTKMDNPSLVRPYELVTRLFAIPEYKEFDPSLLIFIFFPIMFGMILGDIGYGLMTLVVLIMLKKKFRTEGWQQLINIVMIASVWSIIFGIFYGEIFGPLGLWNYIFGMLSHAQIVVLEEEGLFFGEGVYGSLGRLGPLDIFPLYRLATNAVLLLIGVSLFIGVVHCSVWLHFGYQDGAELRREEACLFRAPSCDAFPGILCNCITWTGHGTDANGNPGRNSDRCLHRDDGYGTGRRHGTGSRAILCEQSDILPEASGHRPGFGRFGICR